MASEQIVEEIKKLRVNAVYGKKRHYNASERKRCWHHIIAYTVLALNVLTGSVLFGLAKPYLWDCVPALLAFLSALFIATDEFLKLNRESTEHHAIGSRYLGLARNCSAAVALAGANQITDGELKIKLQNLQKSLTEIDTSAGAYPTNRKDYESSRKGVLDGEERYTAQELNELE